MFATWDHMILGILVDGGRTIRDGLLYDAIFIPMEDQHRALEAPDDGIGVDIPHIFVVLLPETHTPEGVFQRDFPILTPLLTHHLRDTEGGVNQDKRSDIIGARCRSEGGDQPALAQAQEGDISGIDVGATLELIDDRIEVRLLSEDRHICRRTSTQALTSTAVEVEGIAEVAHARQEFGIALAITVRHAEAMTEDDQR